jgi:hypothetical protein
MWGRLATCGPIANRSIRAKPGRLRGTRHSTNRAPTVKEGTLTRGQESTPNLQRAITYRRERFHDYRDLARNRSPSYRRGPQAEPFCRDAIATSEGRTRSDIFPPRAMSQLRGCPSCTSVRWVPSLLRDLCRRRLIEIVHLSFFPFGQHVIRYWKLYQQRITNGKTGAHCVRGFA